MIIITDNQSNNPTYIVDALFGSWLSEPIIDLQNKMADIRLDPG